APLPRATTLAASPRSGEAAPAAGREAAVMGPACRLRTRLLPHFVRVAALSAVTLLVASCGDRGAAGTNFQPAKPGVLTVATAFLPAPGFWEGVPPVDGFEAGLAAALANHLGLHRVHVVQVPFTKILKGHFGGADMALSQMTPTTARERHVDFTTPYLTAPP